MDIKIRYNTLVETSFLIYNTFKWKNVINRHNIFLFIDFKLNTIDCLNISVIYSMILRDKKYGLSVNMIATKIMPTLIPHTMNPGLNLEQFQTLIEVLQDMLEQIDR
jgi:SCY1-like protein 2